MPGPYAPLLTFDIWFMARPGFNINRMETVFWIFVPAFAAVASGVLAWFIMQSRMEVALAGLREQLAESRGALQAEKAAMEGSLETALRAAEETARRQAFDRFLTELRVEQRHYTRENRMLKPVRTSLVLQERMFFRNIPLSDWIEHEIPLDDAADVNRLVRDMTIFDNAVVSIADLPRPKKALA